MMSQCLELFRHERHIKRHICLCDTVFAFWMFFYITGLFYRGGGLCCDFSSYENLILSPWWLGTVSSGACLWPTAALFPTTGGFNEGCL